MSERLRAYWPVLAVILGALLLATLGRREGPPLPTGSTLSAASDGGKALYLWVDSLGRQAQRLESLGALGRRPPEAVLVLAPAIPLDEADRKALDAVPAAGGTLILAGPPTPFRGYLETLGIETSGGPLVRRARTPDGGLEVQVETRQRLSGSGTVPVLVAPDGGAVAVRKPYLAGQVLVLSSVEPFTNDGLRDESTARFVYRVLEGAVPPGGTAGFDKSHYREVTPAGDPVQSIGGLLRETPAGRAVVYGGVLSFLFLLLAGGRLGPPLPPLGAMAPTRTMFEQVQALAGLYRRAGQLPALRRHFVEHYGRIIAGARLSSPRQAAAEQALGQIERATTEGALREAVNRLEAILAPGPLPGEERGPQVP